MWPEFSACVRAGPRWFTGKVELTGGPRHSEGTERTILSADRRARGTERAGHAGEGNRRRQVGPTGH
jgi:hypothetical protein